MFAVYTLPMGAINTKQGVRPRTVDTTRRPRGGSSIVFLSFLLLLVLPQPDTEARAVLHSHHPTGPVRAARVAEGLDSYRELRYRGVIGQTTPYGCGPAAVATLLSHYMGLEAPKDEVLQMAQKSLTARGEEKGQPLAALDLVHAMQGHGLKARGYRITPSALADYFARGGVPLIAHVTCPQNHFLVVVGMLDQRAVLADPSWGIRVEFLDDLESKLGFSGVVLVPLADTASREHAQARQRAVLAEAAQRLARLRRIQETWP